MVRTDRVLGTIQQAMEIERFGYGFYNSMRPFVKDTKGQKFISYLANLELQHLHWLEEAYTKQLINMDAFDESEPTNLSLIGRDEIFIEENMPDLFKNFDPVGAVEYAIKVENKSAEFYERYQDLSDDDRLNDLFKNLVDFERDHIKILEKTLDSLKSRGEWEAPPAQ
jgi:rubrerythrin